MGQPGIGAEVEGLHAVAAAVEAGRVRRLLVEQGRAGVEELISAARAGGAEVELVDDVRPMASTSAPQGVVARCRPRRPVSLEDAVGRSSPAAIVVLDHLEDPRNVGAIARTALAAGFGGLVMSSRRAAPLTAASFKAAAGALEHLDVCVVASTAAAVEDLRRLGLWLVGLDAGAAAPLFGYSLLTEPLAVVIGAEGSGMSRLVTERLDVALSVPIDPRVESLNAAVAAALAFFEVSRMRGFGSGRPVPGGESP